MATARKLQSDPARQRVPPKPEVTFVGILPSDDALSVVREQDALYRSVVDVDHVASHVTLRREHGKHRVQVTSHAGCDRAGEAEHPEMEWAVRQAYTELLRHTLRGCERAAHN